MKKLVQKYKVVPDQGSAPRMKKSVGTEFARSLK